MATSGCRVHNVSHNKAKDGVQHEYLLFEVALLEEEYMSILIAERDAGDTRENGTHPKLPNLPMGTRVGPVHPLLHAAPGMKPMIKSTS